MTGGGVVGGVGGGLTVPVGVGIGVGVVLVPVGTGAVVPVGTGFGVPGGDVDVAVGGGLTVPPGEGVVAAGGAPVVEAHVFEHVLMSCVAQKHASIHVAQEPQAGALVQPCVKPGVVAPALDFPESEVELHASAAMTDSA